MNKPKMKLDLELYEQWRQEEIVRLTEYFQKKLLETLRKIPEIKEEEHEIVMTQHGEHCVNIEGQSIFIPKRLFKNQ